MSFASGYLAKGTLYDKIFGDNPDNNTCIIIVIPAFDETGIFSTLQSIKEAHPPPCPVEIITIVNAPAWADDEQIQRNKDIANRLRIWKAENNAFFNLLIFDTGKGTNKEWGVGMARKAGMDEAVRRFDLVGNPGGLIVSLDADCMVSANYLTELFHELYQEKDRKACSIYFEHPLEGDLERNVYNAVAQYELHLRYYYNGLKYAGYPWVFHTVGSAIAVKAENYVKVGGMSRKQGAEDFYFIQKLIPSGGYFYLNRACVYPSSRLSERVPFGTGPAIKKMIDRKEQHLMTYDPGSFNYLKHFFDYVPSFYDASEKEITGIYQNLHISVRDFLNSLNWRSSLEEIHNNTSSEGSFYKRFFNWFNMLRVVKYLNFVHSEDYLKKIPVYKAALKFLPHGGNNETSDCFGLLKAYREFEKR